MKTAIKEFTNWVKTHPFKSCLFSCLIGILATWDGTRPYLMWKDIVPWIGLIGTMLWVAWGTDMKLISLILSLSLLLPSKVEAQPERPNGAGVIVAIVVTVVGGVVIFKVVNFCQNHFPRQAPPDTNAPPSLEVTDFYAASTSYSSIGVCYEPVGLLASDPIPTVVEFTGYFTADHSFRMETGQRMPEATESVDLYEFGRELVPWGIRLCGAGEVSYGLNGQPCSGVGIPIGFSGGGGNETPEVNVAYGDDVQMVVFERSNDLWDWEPFLTMRISAEQRIKFSDASTGRQKFYRCRPL